MGWTNKSYGADVVGTGQGRIHMLQASSQAWWRHIRSYREYVRFENSTKGHTALFPLQDFFWSLGTFLAFNLRSIDLNPWTVPRASVLRAGLSDDQGPIKDWSLLTRQTREEKLHSSTQKWVTDANYINMRKRNSEDALCLSSEDTSSSLIGSFIIWTFI